MSKLKSLRSMKYLILSLTLLLASCGFSPVYANNGYVPGMGSLIPSFEYLDRNKAKLVNKRVKVAKYTKPVDSIISDYVDSTRPSINLLKGDISRNNSGKASYYWQGQRTANGEVFHPDGISCAHRTAPFNSRIRVTNLVNGKSVICRVNDRGPFINGRVVDLSRGAARQVGMLSAGVVPVSIEIL